MNMTRKEVKINALQEAKEFSKDVRRYLFEIQKERHLTDFETELYNTSHYIHVHTIDAILLIQKDNE